MIKKIISVVVLTFILNSCSEWENEYDFRNYLRDKHPYSEIIRVDEFGRWMYQVNDTINGRIYLYDSGASKYQVEKHLVLDKKSIKKFK